MRRVPCFSGRSFAGWLVPGGAASRRPGARGRAPSISRHVFLAAGLVLPLWLSGMAAAQQNPAQEPAIETPAPIAPAPAPLAPASPGISGGAQVLSPPSGEVA